jgi:hypothetical protein
MTRVKMVSPCCLQRQRKGPTERDRRFKEENMPQAEAKNL